MDNAKYLDFLFDKDVATNKDRLEWFDGRVQQPLSLDHAIKWIDVLNLHGTDYAISLAKELNQGGNICGAIEILKLFACTKLSCREFSTATDAVNQIHIMCLQAGVSPRDFFLDDYLNMHLPKFCPEPSSLDPEESRQGPIKVGYLVPLCLDPKSTIPPIPGELARRHSSDIVATLFFPYSRKLVEERNPDLVKYLETLLPRDSLVFHKKYYQDEWDRVHDFAEIIRSYDLDALITMTALYASSLISYMRPAPKIYAIDVGHPHWYSHRFMDRVFSGHPHFLLEAQTNSIYAPLGFTAGSRTKAVHTSAEKLEKIEFIKHASMVLFSSGSGDKFIGDDFWNVVNHVLESTDVNWIFLGSQPDYVMNRVDSRYHPLVRAFPRSKNFSHFLNHADLYVDSYPIGGGYSVLEAFEKGVPCALFHHDFTQPFNKRENYAPYSHISKDPSFAAVPNKEAYQNHIIDLIKYEPCRLKQIEMQNEAAPKVLESDHMIAAIEQALQCDCRTCYD